MRLLLLVLLVFLSTLKMHSTVNLRLDTIDKIAKEWQYCKQILHVSQEDAVHVAHLKYPNDTIVGCFGYCIAKRLSILTEDKYLEAEMVKAYLGHYKDFLRQYPRVMARFTVLVACFSNYVNPDKKNPCLLVQSLIECVDKYEARYGEFKFKKNS